MELRCQPPRKQCWPLHHAGGGVFGVQEDQSRIYSTKHGFSATICDGHADEGRVATAVCRYVPEEMLRKSSSASGRKFTKRIQGCLLHVQQWLEANHMKRERKANTELLSVGTCLLFSWVEGNLLRTVNVGDSEAFVYRKVEKEIVEIPLSYVSTWMDEPDRTRFKKASGGREPEHDKDRPFKDAINCPRTLGDAKDRHYLSLQEEITEFHLLPGDLLLQVCDGPLDYPPINAEGEVEPLLTIVTRLWESPEQISGAIIDSCLRRKSRSDEYRQLANGTNDETQREALRAAADRYRLADNLSATTVLFSAAQTPTKSIDMWASEHQTDKEAAV